MNTIKQFGALVVLLFFVVVSVGCRTYGYSHTEPSGEVHEIWVSTLLSDSSLSKLEVRIGTNTVLHLEGYTQNVNDEAVKAITEGVTSAILKSAKPIP